MAWRQNAWNAPTLRKVGAAAAAAASGSSGGTGWYNSVFLPGVWYPPGGLVNTDAGFLQYAAPTSAILWAIPQAFPVAGTITDLATYTKGNGGASTSVWIALYRSNAARTAPGARIFSALVAVANFANTKTEQNALGIAVAAGEIIWFAAVTNGCDCLGIHPVVLFPMLGTNFDGSGGANPLRAYQVGYRVAFAFAQPPDPWAGNTLLLQTDDGGAGGAPVALFKFTPS